jgi:hypothetical protein
MDDHVPSPRAGAVQSSLMGVLRKDLIRAGIVRYWYLGFRSSLSSGLL